jgi:DNA polymerase III sliding clamp (beta) subunit (PCNA family)
MSSELSHEAEQELCHRGRPEKDTLRLVATDGHRLALVERIGIYADLKRGYILPRKGLAAVLAALGRKPSGTVYVNVTSKTVKEGEIPPAVVTFRVREGDVRDAHGRR